MTERDNILAEFQSFTGLENIEECIAVLEQHDWILELAVQNTITSLDGNTPVENFHCAASDPVAPIGPADPPALTSPRLLDDSLPEASPNSQRCRRRTISPPTTSPLSRLITFKIEFRERTITLQLRETSSVGEIKGLLAHEIGASQEGMTLTGWVNKNDRLIQDHDVLKDLRLPEEITLCLLIDPSLCTIGCHNRTAGSCRRSAEVEERLFQTFILNVHYNDKSFPVNFLGSRTILEVKQSIYSVISVPVRYQKWTGWPIDDDSMTLAGSGIELPVHELIVENTQPPGGQATLLPSTSVNESDEDLDMEAFATEDPDMYEHSPDKGRLPLIPDSVANEREASESFSRVFENRFGGCHPVFYLGTLEEALKDSVHLPARERKILAVYLHHDKSIFANVFAAQVLCSETFVSYITRNCVTWAWDMTSEENKNKFLTLSGVSLSPTLAVTARNYTADQLPVLVLISKNRSTIDIVSVLHGNSNLDETLMSLMQAVEVVQEQQTLEIKEEDEREARENVKREQDRAYSESLQADRRKEEQKKQDEAERQKQEQEDLLKQLKLEEQKRQEEDEKNAISRSLADQLPDEPPDPCSEPVTIIRIRTPLRMLQRRFLAQHPLQLVLNYITAEGFHVNEYKVLTTFPRRDLSLLDTSKTLMDLKLYPQETLILEQK